MKHNEVFVVAVKRIVTTPLKEGRFVFFPLGTRESILEIIVISVISLRKH